MNAGSDDVFMETLTNLSDGRNGLIHDMKPEYIAVNESRHGNGPAKEVDHYTQYVYVGFIALIFCCLVLEYP